VSRRVKLPGADELFRPTPATPEPTAEPTLRAVAAPAGDDSDVDEKADAKRTPSGRVKHDEKITVYVTEDELFDLEHTRLTLRREHSLAVDRGRIVREAIHLALEGVHRDGADSLLVRRLSET
jgi:hypothetical protein